MNDRFILSNVREAHEELTKLLQMLESGERLDFEGFHVQMAHTFHHLNSAWNGRNISDNDWHEYTDETYARLKVFPSDLPMSGDENYYDLPEYETISKEDEAEQSNAG